MPIPTDSGQGHTAIAGEICGCVLEGKTSVADDSQDHIAIVFEIGGRILESMSIRPMAARIA